MIQQLIPLLVVGGIFAVYGIVQSIRFWLTMRELDAFEKKLRNIKLAETPFMRLMKDNK